MSEIAASATLLAVLFALLAGGVWVGLTLAGVAWFGMEFFTARAAGDGNASAQPLAITFDDGQSQARAGITTVQRLVHLLERGEDRLQSIGRNTTPRIGDPQTKQGTRR